MTRGLLGQSHSPPAVILQSIKYALLYDLQTKLLDTLLIVCASSIFFEQDAKNLGSPGPDGKPG